MRKKHSSKVRVSSKRDLNWKKVLFQNQNLFIWKWIIPFKWDPSFINPLSHFVGRLKINIPSRFKAGMFLFIKHMRDPFEDCRRTFDEKRNKTELKLITYWPIFSIKQLKKWCMLQQMLKIKWTQKLK